MPCRLQSFMRVDETVSEEEDIETRRALEERRPPPTRLPDDVYETLDNFGN